MTRKHANQGLDADLALYIHVPFCGQRCAYCHFDIKVLHPKTDPGPWFARYLEAVEQELENRSKWVAGRSLTSIFFGGGTPSRLAPSALKRLLEKIKCEFPLHQNIEINIEANPEDVGPETLWEWHRLGINRVSFGVQTFHDPSLRTVRRPHDARGALAALTGRPSFSKGVSLDLMLGLPLQTPETLQEDLAIVGSLDLEHVSVYMLERDLPTPLDALGKGMAMPSEDDQADAYEVVCNELGRLGFEQYEISNFAKPGFACRHNQVYWQCGDYLGIGPAAHGRVGNHYWANQKTLTGYIAAVAKQGWGLDWQENWSQARLAQEALVQGMRLSEGVSGEEIPPEIRPKIKEFLQLGLLCQTGHRLALTMKGKLLANEVFEVLLNAESFLADPHSGDMAR